MKNINKSEFQYRRGLHKSLIIAISALILLFYLFPKFEGEAKLPDVEIDPEIIIIDIPRTIQKTKRRLPKPVKPVIPVAADETEILNEVTIQPDSIRYLQLPRLVDGAYLSDDLPYLPRQIVEVLPKREKGVYGIITLSLKIDVNGKVNDYKVLENTTGSSACLKNVLEAAKKSCWESVHLGENKVEYWINKTYLFEQNE